MSRIFPNQAQYQAQWQDGVDASPTGGHEEVVVENNVQSVDPGFDSSPDPGSQISLTELETALSQSVLERALFEQAGVGVAFSDQNLRLLKANPRLCDLLAYSQAELQARRLPELTHPDDLAICWSAVQTLQTGQSSVSFECRYLRQDGSTLWACTTVSQVDLAPSYSETYQSVASHVYVATIQAVHRQQAGTTFQQREAQLSSILNCTNASITRLRRLSQHDFQFDYMSVGCQRVFGFTAEEFLADKYLWRSRVFPEDLPLLVLPEQATQSGTTTAEYRFKHKDGSVRWIAGFVTTEWDASSNCWIVTAVDVDITKPKRTEAERKQAQIALQQSQERLAFLLTSSPAVIYTAQIQAPCAPTFVSENIEALTGYRAEQFCQNSSFWIQHLHPEDVPLADQAVSQLLDSGSLSCEYRFLHRDGSYRWIQAAAKLIRDATDNPLEMIGYCIDITSRKTAELALQQLNADLEQRVQTRTIALQESEELFRQFAENMPKVFWMEDLDGHLLYVNPSFVEVWGITTADLYKNPRAWLEAVHPEDRAWMSIISLNRLECHEDDFEYRILKPDAEICWIRERAFPIYDQQGAVYRIARIAEDITAQKQSEVEICRSRDLFEALFQESADAIFLVNPVTLLILDCNQRAVALFEASHKRDLIGIPGHTLHRYPFPEAALNIGQQQLATKGVWSDEIEYRTCKGGYFWGNIAARSIQVAGLEMMLIRITDISQRKQSEQQLQQQANREALLRQVAFRTRESLNLNYILNTSVKQVQAFLQSDRVLIYQFEANGGGYIAVEAVSAPRFSILGEYYDDPCFSMQAAERYQQGYVSAISDIHTADLPTCYVEFLAQVQVRANLVVPILQAEQLWGLLLAHHCTDSRRWQPFELELLNQFADQVGIAIRQTNLYANLETQLAERRRAEQALAQQVQYEQLLQTISQQIRSSLRLEEILAAAVTQVQQVLQVDRAIVFRLNSNGSGHIIKEAALPQYPVTPEMQFPEEEFPPECRQFYEHGQSRVINSVDDDVLAECLIEFMHQIQVKSKLVVPIVQTEEDGSTVWGLLILHACAAQRQWQISEVELMQKVAVQMGIAIQQSDLYLQLENQLQQKEILIKEIHHRVKNNLQVISAMLKLQARATQDTAVLDVLEDSRNRLRAIALIHEILYQSPNLEQLNFDQYIQRLASTILATHSNSNQIRLVYQLQSVCLNLDTAIPCGLLLSELITNAIKHAFPNGQGTISISLETSGRTFESQEQTADENIPLQHQYTQYTLAIEDDGIGIPANLDLNQLQSLGLKIAYDLALQLQGTLTLERSQGTRFQLIFSELKYRKRL